MTVETKAILHINQQVETVAPTQMAIDAIIDPELGFRPWGGRDAQGQATRWAALRKAASFTTMRLTGATTSGNGLGVLQHDSNGNIHGGPLSAATLPDHNDMDALQGGTFTERYHLTAAQVAVVNAAVIQDGTRSFTGRVKGIDPVDPADLVTKSYVDAISADWDFLEPAISLWDASAGLPVAPTLGDRYVCSVAGNGWNLNSVYERSATTWVETIPHIGNAIVIGSGVDTAMYVFTGTTWKSVGSTTVAPLNEIITGTGTGYTSSSTAKVETTRLIIDEKHYATNHSTTNYVTGGVAPVAHHAITRVGEYDPPDSFFEEIIGEDINTSATAWIMDRVFTNAVADGHPASVEYDLYPFTRTRQGIIVGATPDPLRHLATMANSTIAQITLVYDGEVGQEFRGSFDMGPTDRTGYLGVFDRNMVPFEYPLPTPVFDWTFEVEKLSGYAPISFSETYTSQLITGGLNISGGRAPGLAANSFRRDTYLYPEYLINGRQPAHIKHGVDATDERVLAWNYTYTPATHTISIPAGAHVWFRGSRYAVGGTSAVLDGGIPPSGKYYVKFQRNETTGAVSLVANTTPCNVFTDVLVCLIYVNNEADGGPADFDFDHRHNCFVPLDWHYNLSQTTGARVVQDGGFAASDFVLSSPSLSDRQPIFASGTILDADLSHTLPLSTKGVYSTAYLWGSGTGVSWQDGRSVQVEVGSVSDIAQRNIFDGSNWILQDIPNNHFAAVYEVLTMRGNVASARLFAVPQFSYDTEAEALAEMWGARESGDFNALGSVILRKWIIQVKNSFLTPGKYQIIRVQDLTVSGSGSMVSAVPVHNALTGRDTVGAHPLAAITGTTAGRIPVVGATGLEETIGLQYHATIGLILRGNAGVTVQSLDGAHYGSMFADESGMQFSPEYGKSVYFNNSGAFLWSQGQILEGAAGLSLSAKYAAIVHSHILGDLPDAFQILNGWKSRTLTTISCPAGVFTITPTGSTFDFWAGAIKYTKTGAQTISGLVDGVQNFVYYNSAGVLTTSTSAWDLLGDVAPVATVFRVGSFYSIGEERHAAERDRANHKYLHTTRGAAYDAGKGGGVLTSSSSAFSITALSVWDEDIENAISTKTSALLWYRAAGGAAMTNSAATVAILARVVTGSLRYDLNGTSTAVPTNNFVANWVYGTNDIDNPIYVVVGQAVHTTVALARNATEPSTPALSTREWKLLYRVIWQNVGGTPTYVEASDYRTTGSLPGGTVAVVNFGSVVGAASTVAVFDAAGFGSTLPSLDVVRGGTGLTSVAINSILYASAANTMAALAPNTTTTKKVLCMTGDGTNGAAPVWDTVNSTITGTANRIARFDASGNLGTDATLFWDGTRMGVGRTAAAGYGTLQVQHDGTTDVGLSIYDNQAGHPVNSGGSLWFLGHDTSDALMATAAISGWRSSASGTSAHLNFSVRDSGNNFVSPMQLTSSALFLLGQRALRFYDADNTKYAAIQAPATIATNYSLTLPVDDGAATNVLTTDGAGVLSWTAKPTLTKTITIETPTNTDIFPIFKTDVPITIQEIIGVIRGGTSVTCQIVKGTAVNSTAGCSASTTVNSLTSGNLFAQSGPGGYSVDADNWVQYTCTAVSGTVATITVDIRYTEN